MTIGNNRARILTSFALLVFALSWGFAESELGPSNAAVLGKRYIKKAAKKKSKAKRCTKTVRGKKKKVKCPAKKPPVAVPAPPVVEAPAPPAPPPPAPVAKKPAPPAAPGAGGGTSVGGSSIAGCPIFPSDNPWNRDVSKDPLHPQSNTFLASIDASGRRFLHPDFGSNPDYGIPYVVVPAGQARVPINFTEYGDESDPGPYPVPSDAPVEAGSDAHALVLSAGECKLYEMYHARFTDPGWDAGSGAVFDLRSNALRPDTWTSADAAGLPILPGLVRYDEVASGRIDHALRFTVSRTQRGFIHPATHYAGTSDWSLPPMGLRLRMKSSFDLSPYHGQSRVILEALKRYGMIVADNGSSWFITGSRDSRWNDDDLNQMKGVPSSAFEAVDSGPILRP